MVEAAWSEELGKWWELPLPCMVGGLQQKLLCKPHQVNLDMRLDESCPCQGTSLGVCRRHEEQARPGGPERPGRGGQLHPTALHGPGTDFTMLLLFLTSG